MKVHTVSKGEYTSYIEDVYEIYFINNIFIIPYNIINIAVLFIVTYNKRCIYIIYYNY